MTLTSIAPFPDLSTEEWAEAKALLAAISDNPATVVPSKMERFSFLFARSLQGKGDTAQ
jgi:hypothetical protein